MMAKTNVDEYIQMMKAQRDAKVQNHLDQYAPVWLVDDVASPDKDVLQFDVVFYHPEYHWVRRRYVYDAFTDVLHLRGQVPVDEDEALALEESESYINGGAGNSALSYGG